jgi:predicted permease
MRWLRHLVRSIRPAGNRADVDEEIRLHLEMEAEDLERQGASSDEARRRARVAFGGVERFRAEAQEVRRLMWLEVLAVDLRHALRSLARSPGVSIATVATLTVAVGLVVTVFTTANAIFLRPWPVQDPGSVFRLTLTPGPEAPASGVDTDNPSSPSYRELEHLQDQAIRSDLVAYHRFGARIGRREGDDEREQGLIVSRQFFDVLGVPFQHGRGFAYIADRTDPVAVISHSLWRRAFAADPQIVGRSVILHGIPTTIVGVLPREFPGIEPDPVDVYVPFPDAGAWTSAWHNWWGPAAEVRPERLTVFVAVRLRPGSTRTDALAELRVLHAQFTAETQAPSSELALIGTALGQQPGMPSAYPIVFALLLASTTCVLALACANVANLHLARGLARGREIATRLALGASRARIVRQLILEGWVLAVVAGAGAILIASVLPSLVIRGVSASPIALRLTPDLTVLAFSLLLCAAATMAFALMPALQVTRTASLQTGLQAGRTTRTSIGTLRALLLTTQVALATVLLAGAVLLVRGLVHAVSAERLGFATDFVAGAIRQPGAGANGSSAAPIAPRLVDALTDSGATDVTFAWRAPLYGRCCPPPEPVRLLDVPGDVTRSADIEGVASSFFDVMDVPLVAGRPFSDDAARREIVVNEAFALAAFGSARAAPGSQVAMRGEVHRIVGVARNAHLTTIDRVSPTVFHPFVAGLPTLLVRERPPQTADRLRAIVSSVDPALAVDLVPSGGVLSGVTRQSRFGAAMASSISGVALAFTVVGILGIFAYVVEERRREIGIRVALGAGRREVFRLLLMPARTALAGGLAAGLLLSAGTGSLLGRFLYGLSPLDPFSYAIVAAILTAAAVGATSVPARRALRVDPVLTLRAE